MSASAVVCLDYVHLCQSACVGGRCHTLNLVLSQPKRSSRFLHGLSTITCMWYNIAFCFFPFNVYLKLVFHMCKLFAALVQWWTFTALRFAGVVPRLLLFALPTIGHRVYIICLPYADSAKITTLFTKVARVRRTWCSFIQFRLVKVLKLASA